MVLTDSSDRALRVLQETADTENLSLMAQAEHAMKTASLHMTRVGSFPRRKKHCLASLTELVGIRSRRNES